MIDREPVKIPPAVWVWFAALAVAAVPPVITEIGQYFRERREQARKVDA